MPSYVIYPEADGWAYSFSSGKYFSDLRNANGTSSGESGGCSFRITSHSVLDEYNYIGRGLFFCDTSVIDSTEATIEGYISMVIDSVGNEWSFDPYLGFYNHVGSHNTYIDNNDYQKCTSNIVVSTILKMSSFGHLGTRIAWPLSVTNGIPRVNKEGYTTFCLREVSHDANNVAPTWENNKNMFATFRGVEYTGTTSDPYLVIITTASPLNAGVKVGDQIYGLLEGYVNVGGLWQAITLGSVNVSDTWYDIL